jgi:hypothetical protein
MVGGGGVRVRILSTILAAAAAIVVVGCSHQGDSLVLAGDGTRLSSEEIDKDPLALLPGSPIGVVYADAQAAFGSQVGPAALAMMAAAVPLGADANFDAKRDVQKVYIGFYSLQGADLAAVIQGSFDPDAIQASVTRNTPTPLGVTLGKLTYAGNDLYVAGGLGFSVVTRHTIVAGNEAGMRRVLDRIRDKRVRRDMADWMVQLIESPKAAIVGVVDLTSQPMVSSLSQQLPFLSGLKVARVLGNYQNPGLNFAGALTYPDPATAAQASQSVQRIAQLASYSSLLALLGIRPPIQDMQARTEQSDVQFIVSVDAQSASGMVDAMSQAMRASALKK